MGTAHCYPPPVVQQLGQNFRAVQNIDTFLACRNNLRILHGNGTGVDHSGSPVDVGGRMVEVYCRS